MRSIASTLFDSVVFTHRSNLRHPRDTKFHICMFEPWCSYALVFLLCSCGCSCLPNPPPLMSIMFRRLETLRGWEGGKPHYLWGFVCEHPLFSYSAHPPTPISWDFKVLLGIMGLVCVEISPAYNAVRGYSGTLVCARFISILLESSCRLGDSCRTIMMMIWNGPYRGQIGQHT